MCDALDLLNNGESHEWVAALPAYQKEPLQELLRQGQTYEEVADAWLTATTEHTFKFGVSTSVGDKKSFLANVKNEFRAFLCGDKRYKKERDGLFGEKSLARTYVVSAIAVAIAPHLSVAATVIAPVLALLLASMGKITVNAWCASQADGEAKAP